MIYRKLINWIRSRYNQVISSIAFLPAIIALGFLLLSWLMIMFDFSKAGQSIKENLGWLSLKDATTARSIISAVVAGIISLSVFSFSMVMIVLNQAASQMSNRILDNLIGNRFQQVVLGIYIGTIVFALSLLSTIRDIDTGVQVPALSTYMVIALTICDIFLFIYFLHYITQSVKYETIIHRIFKTTCASLKKECTLFYEPIKPDPLEGFVIKTPRSGIFQGFEKHQLVKLCDETNTKVQFHFAPGTFLLHGTNLLTVRASGNAFGEKQMDELCSLLKIHRGEPIDSCFYFGFTQLSEVAIKALSPGINDPATACQSLRALAELLLFRLHHFPNPYILNDNQVPVIFTTERSFDELLAQCIFPIWDYGKNDRIVQNEMKHLFDQFPASKQTPALHLLKKEILSAINKRTPDAA